MSKTVAPAPIEIPRMDIRGIRLTLIGDSPLICHAWSTKAKRTILDRQMRKAQGPKATKDPVADYWESLYIVSGEDRIDRTAPTVPDGIVFGFPVVGFKNAAVDAASFVDGLTKVVMRGALHISGELTVIQGVPRMREDMVKISMGTSDIRYRGEFPDWSTDLDIRYNAGLLSPEQIAHLFTIAGFSIGVGEWRPQRDGSYGRFHVG